MAELLNSFLQQMQDDSSTVDIKSALSTEELLNWETLVKVFDEIEMDNIAISIEKVNQRYKLERWQEISVLSYIKLLEMMVERMKHLKGAVDDLDNVEGYNGSMFG